MSSEEVPGVQSIVVPLDLDVVGDRALPIAGSLARAQGLPIELLTIKSPRMEAFLDVCELGRRVKVHGLGPHSINVLYDDDAGRAITRYVAGRNDALVVMGSTAKGPASRARLWQRQRARPGSRPAARPDRRPPRRVDST